VPATYSCSGTFPADQVRITGSTIRQASSASSPRMNIMGSPPGDGEQLCEVSAAGINYADTHHRE
jgi:NADPH:quinone reductase-like Zn-dependent oxidoreductase